MKTGFFFFIAAFVSIVVGIMNGKISSVSAAVLDESTHAVEFSIKLLGSVCFWSGIMETARQSGIIDGLCKILKPLLALVFPGIRNEKEALGTISMNIAANLLGLGNAATPFGIKAMKELHKISGFSSSATAEMVCFVVINTASLQLLPTTAAVLRLQNGAKAPLDIIPAVWFVSACSLLAGIIAAKIGFRKRKSE